MDWIRINDEDNQDLDVEYIGPLIHKKGFKARYTNVETYSDEMRQRLARTYSKHGYDVRILYNNTFAYCEVTATKQKSKYIELALALCLLWASYRIYTYY